MKFIVKVFMVALILFMPLMVILAAMNIVLRMPDVYVYHFNSEDSSSQLNFGLKNEELGDIISSFMFNQAEDFTIQGNDGENDTLGIPLTTEEKETMQHFRNILNVTFVMFFLLFVLLAVMYYWIFHFKHKEVLRIVIKGSWITHLILAAVSIALLSINKTSEVFYSFLFQPQFVEEGMLSFIFTKKLAAMSIGATVVIAAILLFLITWMTRKLTRPKRIFARK